MRWKNKDKVDDSGNDSSLCTVLFFQHSCCSGLFTDPNWTQFASLHCVELLCFVVEGAVRSRFIVMNSF